MRGLLVLRSKPCKRGCACTEPHLQGVGHEQPEAANVRLRNRMGGWFSRPPDLSDTKKPQASVGSHTAPGIPLRAQSGGFLKDIETVQSQTPEMAKRHSWSCARL